VFASNSSGIRAATLKKNGTAVIEYAINNQGGSIGATMIFNKTVAAVATDYFQMFVYQDSTSTINIEDGNKKTYFNMTYLGA
jgi:hypothetical protein